MQERPKPLRFRESREKSKSVHAPGSCVTQSVKWQSCLFRVHGTAGAAASLPRRDTLNPDALRGRPQHVLLDSKPWSCTNGLLITSIAFDSGWTVTAGEHLGTGLPGHTRLPVFQTTSATRLRPTKDQYRSSTHSRRRRYSAANAGCRVCQSREQSKLISAVLADAASQHKMAGSMQEESSGAVEHRRLSCLLEHPMVFLRQGSLISSALSELRLAMRAPGAGVKISGVAAERRRALRHRQCMLYAMCMFTEPPLRMRNAKYMRVGILTGVKAPDQGVLSPGPREVHRAVPIQPPETQGGGSRGPHQSWARLSSNLSR